jgi:hypothetical protein
MQKHVYFDYYDVRTEASVQFGEKYTAEEWEKFWEELMEEQANNSQEGILVISPQEMEYEYYWNLRTLKFREIYVDLLELVQREAGCDRAGINFKF